MTCNNSVNNGIFACVFSRLKNERFLQFVQVALNISLLIREYFFSFMCTELSPLSHLTNNNLL